MIRCSETEPSVACGPMPGNGAARQHQHVRIGRGPPIPGTRRTTKAPRRRPRRWRPARARRRATCRPPAARTRSWRHRHGSSCSTISGRAEQIGRERAGRDRLDPAFLGRRAEHEAAHHQQRGEHEARDDVEGMRRRPSTAPHCRHGKVQSSANTMVVTASQRHSRIRASAERCRGDDGEIDVERPVVGLVGRDQDRRDEARRRRRGRPAPARAAARRRACPARPCRAA